MSGASTISTFHGRFRSRVISSACRLSTGFIRTKTNSLLPVRLAMYCADATMQTAWPALPSAISTPKTNTEVTSAFFANNALKASAMGKPLAYARRHV
eukprot:9496400-Pyramimonas_sp.AAC.1